MKLRVQAKDGAILVADSRGPAAAPVLLFLNSIGCDRHLWERQVAVLNAGFRCLTFDARGHGESDAPDGDYTIAQLAQDALAVMDAAGARTAHICGLSLGGIVAQQLAIGAPDRVVSLTLANTASRIGSFESWQARRQLVIAEGLASIADMAMERFFSEAFRTAQPEVVADQRARLLAGSARGYAGCCAALRDADLSAELWRIAAPTLVIGGELDVSTLPDQAAALVAAIPGAALKILPAAHLSNLEQPEAFTAALRAHLEAA